MSKETVRVPDIGGVDAAEVVELLVAVGDEVELEQGLLVLESDKASLEIPSTAAGKVLEVLATEGSQLAEGDPVVVIETEGQGEREEATHSAGGDDDAEAPGDEPSVDTAPETTDPETTAPASTGSVETTTVTVPVPDIGTEDAVDVVEVAISAGDTISEGDTLIVLESDKASMDVPSTVSGTVSTVHVKDGSQVREGDAIADVDVATSHSDGAQTDAFASSPVPDSKGKEPDSTSEGGPAPDAPDAKEVPPEPSPKSPPVTEQESGGGAQYAGPAVRRLAREFGVPLQQVRGSGPKGRILKEDLHQYVQSELQRERSSGGAGLPDVPDVDFSRFGAVDVQPRSKIDRLTASNMQRSWLNVPHVTQFDDIDITELEAFRQSLKAEGEQRGTKLTLVPILLKACAIALKRHEKINASLSDKGETLTYKRYVHIGMAVDTPAGLVVPVLRDVDQKPLWDLAAEVVDLATRARDRKLKPQEMQGGGFTVSSLGAIGGRGFTPIVNTPEVAILGVGRASMQPVWGGSSFEPRMQLPVSLSYDHRVVNGGDGGRFLTELKSLMEDLRRLLL